MRLTHASVSHILRVLPKSPSFTLGRGIQLNGQSFRVTGILPAGRNFPDWADVLLPIPQLGDYDLTHRKHHPLEVVGRLKTGASLLQAQAELDEIAQRLQRAYPATNNTIGAKLIPLREQLAGDSRKPLLLLLSSAGLILPIACANVANLLLARGAMRQKEMTIRAALEAARARLLRQLLTESIALALPGGALGLLSAMWAAPVFEQLGAGFQTRPNAGNGYSRISLHVCSRALDWNSCRPGKLRARTIAICLSKIAALPGVEGVASITPLPLPALRAALVLLSKAGPSLRRAAFRSRRCDRSQKVISMSSKSRFAAAGFSPKRMRESFYLHRSVLAA